MTRTSGALRVVVVVGLVIGVAVGAGLFSGTATAEVSAFSIQSGDNVISPDDSFGFYGFFEGGSNNVYVVIDENGNGTYDTGEAYTNISVSGDTFDAEFREAKPVA